MVSAKERFDDALAWVLGTEQGRLFLAQVVYEVSKLESESFTGERVSTDYNLGQRSVGRWLMEAAERVEPQLADKMVSEYRVARREMREQSRSDRINASADASS